MASSRGSFTPSSGNVDSSAGRGYHRLVLRTLQLGLALWRPRPPVPGFSLLDPSVTRMRVRLGDLDVYRHVNNGVYLRYMDLGRLNYLADLGAFPVLAKHRWYPVVAASTVRYRRSLTWRQLFTITTRVVGWDERVVYLVQEIDRAGEPVARGWVAGRFLHRSGQRIAAPDVVTALSGERVVQPALPDAIAAWARSVGVAAR